jgi:hypothetical protein
MFSLQITKTMGKVLQTMDLGKIQLTMDKFEQVGFCIRLLSQFQNLSQFSDLTLGALRRHSKTRT